MGVRPSSRKSWLNLCTTRAILLVLAAAAAQCLIRISSLAAWTPGRGFADVRLRVAAPLLAPAATEEAEVMPWGHPLHRNGLRFQRGSVARRAHLDAEGLAALFSQEEKYPEEVLDLLSEEIDDNPNLNDTHIAIVLGRLVIDKREIDDRAEESPGLAKLIVKVQGWLRIGALGPAEVATIFGLVAQLKNLLPPLQELLPELVMVLRLFVSDLTSREASDLLLACAHGDLHSMSVGDVLPCLAKRLLYLSDHWDAEQVAAMFSASAECARSYAPPVMELLPTLTEKIPRLAEDMTPSSVAKMLSAAAVLRHYERSLDLDGTMEALTASLRPALLDGASAREMGDLFWGMAVTNCTDEAALANLSAAAIEKMRQWEGQDAELQPAMIACSLAKLQVMDRPLLHAIVKKSEPFLPRMDVWSLCALIYTFRSPRALKDPEFADFQLKLRQAMKDEMISADMVILVPLGPELWYRQFD